MCFYIRQKGGFAQQISKGADSQGGYSLDTVGQLPSAAFMTLGHQSAAATTSPGSPGLPPLTPPLGLTPIVSLSLSFQRQGPLAFLRRGGAQLVGLPRSQLSPVYPLLHSQ